MIFRILLALLLAVFAAAAPAQRVTSIAIEAPWLGLPQVPVTLNDRVSARFIVDTAASETVMTDALIARLGIDRYGQPAHVDGATGRSPLMYYRLARLRLGDRTFRDLGAYNFPSLAAPVGADGLLGADVLRRHVVEFDMPNAQLRLHDRRANLLAGNAHSWDIIPAYQRRDGFLIVDVTIGGLTIPALVDTGAVQNLVNTAAARLLGLRLVPESDSRESITGASGHVQTMNQLDLSGFAIGTTQFGAARLGVVDLAIFETLGMGDRPAMLLSAEALSSKRFVLDYPRSRLLIERTPG